MIQLIHSTTELGLLIAVGIISGAAFPILGIVATDRIDSSSLKRAAKIAINSAIAIIAGSGLVASILIPVALIPRNANDFASAYPQVFITGDVKEALIDRADGTYRTLGKTFVKDGTTYTIVIENNAVKVYGSVENGDMTPVEPRR